MEGDIETEVYTIQATGTDDNLLNCCGVIKSYKIFVCRMTNRVVLKALQIPNKTKFVKYTGPLSIADRGNTNIFEFFPFKTTSNSVSTITSLPYGWNLNPD